MLPISSSLIIPSDIVSFIFFSFYMINHFLTFSFFRNLIFLPPLSTTMVKLLKKSYPIAPSGGTYSRLLFITLYSKASYLRVLRYSIYLYPHLPGLISKGLISLVNDIHFDLLITIPKAVTVNKAILRIASTWHGPIIKCYIARAKIIYYFKHLRLPSTGS